MGEIHGVTLHKLSPEDFAFINKQFLQHGVVFFRDRTLTPEDHLDLARRFGRINVNGFFAKVKGYPEIAQLLKEKDDVQAIGESFHTDHSYDVEPALGSILVAREVPKKGGDTVFVDMCKAYETLPEEIKKKLEGMNAVHTTKHVFTAAASNVYSGEKATTDPAVRTAVHPVVLVHPQSGRKALYVNPTFTAHFEGMTATQSRPLLEALYHHAAQPQHLHRFQWEVGSIAMWDNRVTWHMAVNDYHGQRRLMHRVTIDGCKLSELNNPERLPATGIDVDAERKYDPNDALNVALIHRALGPTETRLSKL